MRITDQAGRRMRVEAVVKKANPGPKRTRHGLREIFHSEVATSNPTKQEKMTLFRPSFSPLNPRSYSRHLLTRL